jgi:hypothetical protein
VRVQFFGPVEAHTALRTQVRLLAGVDARVSDQIARLGEARHSSPSPVDRVDCELEGGRDGGRAICLLTTRYIKREGGLATRATMGPARLPWWLQYVGWTTKRFYLKTSVFTTFLNVVLLPQELVKFLVNTSWGGGTAQCLM